MSERGTEFDTRREAYEAARDNLAGMINIPDKTVTIAEYRTRIKEAQKVAQAAHAAMIAAG